MPWRETRDPYKIFVSEIMLQQTQVPRVLEKYPLFIKRFPTWRALANASTKDVLQEWQGLGYNRRGLNLKRSAEMIVRDFGGKLPNTPEGLLKLPGIGPATAGSLQAFAFDKPVVFIETNIRSVYIHHFFDQPQINADNTPMQADIHDKKDIADRELIPYIEKTLPNKYPACLADNPNELYRQWYWALMDYGTELKKSVGNSSRRSSHYTKQSKFEGSNRQVRANILKLLLARPNQTENMLAKQINDDRLEANLQALKKEGLIARDKTRYYIPN